MTTLRSKITAALDTQGIAYELRNNGTALAVQKSATAQARIALAGQGVQTSGGGTQPGNELLDQSKLGASQFQQQLTAQRALEAKVPVDRIVNTWTAEKLLDWTAS